MSRPLQMNCSKCGRDITMAGSEMCGVCYPMGPDATIEQFEAAEKQPLLCHACFQVAHADCIKVEHKSL